MYSGIICGTVETSVYDAEAEPDISIRGPVFYIFLSNKSDSKNLFYEKSKDNEV
jgi:hypothetical protein